MNKGVLAITTFIIALIAWLGILSYRFFLTKKGQTRIPIKLFIIFILGTLFFTLLIISFCKIAYEMWDSRGVAGSIRYSNYGTLQGIHMLFLVMFMILIINLWISLFRRFSITNWYSFIGSIIFLLCINISFYYTFPRYGDEGVEGFLFLIPSFIIADLFLIVTIFLFVVVTIIRQIKEKSKRYMINESSLETKD